MSRPSRATAALVLIPLLAVACSTAAPAGPTPSTPVAASPSATAAATDAPIGTEAPTEAPVATEAPTEAPVASEPPTEAPVASEAPTEAPSGMPIPSVAADSTFLFADDFEAGASAWGTGDLGAAGSIAAEDGVLRFTADAAQGSLQSTKPLAGGPWEEIATSGRFTALAGDGTLMGFFCRGATDALVGAVISADGNWGVIAGTTTGVTVTEQGTLPEGSVAIGQEAHVSFQCSVATATEPNMVRLAVGQTIAATTEIPADQASIDGFTQLGLWVEPITPPMEVTVDDVSAVGRHEPRREGPAPTAAP
jgi:hypothetical protein